MPARELAARAAAYVSLSSRMAAADLLGMMQRVDAEDALHELAARAAACARPNKPAAGLVRSHRADGADARARLDNPWEVAGLLGELRQAGAGDAIRTLLARDPTAHVRLDDPWGIAVLMDELCEAGADDRARTLAARAAAHVSLSSRMAAADLLGMMQRVDAEDALHELAARAANAGMFELFLKTYPDEVRSYLFGREPDGTPSQSWRWEEPGQLGPRSADKAAGHIVPLIQPQNA